MVGLLALKDILEPDMEELKAQTQVTNKDYRQAEKKWRGQYDILKKKT